MRRLIGPGGARNDVDVSAPRDRDEVFVRVVDTQVDAAARVAFEPRRVADECDRREQAHLVAVALVSSAAGERSG